MPVTRAPIPCGTCLHRASAVPFARRRTIVSPGRDGRPSRPGREHLTDGGGLTFCGEDYGEAWGIELERNPQEPRGFLVWPDGPRFHVTIVEGFPIPGPSDRRSAHKAPGLTAAVFDEAWGKAVATFSTGSTGHSRAMVLERARELADRLNVEHVQELRS